ncbi:UNVERIFIED_CONTAM: hypothetical protein GTU68_002513 [Idotea baltica]|nr:hypothetical protein [Idotea baltica]
MQWTDIIDIAIELEEKHPGEDVPYISFPKLQQLVLELEDFDDDPKRCNEKVLEAIQAAWLDEKE